MNRKGFLGALTAALAVPGSLLRGNVPPAPSGGTRENLGVDMAAGPDRTEILELNGVDVPVSPDAQWNCRCAPGVLPGHVADLTDGSYKVYAGEEGIRRGDLLEIDGKGHLVRALPPYEVDRVLVALEDRNASGHVIVDWSP